jgi:hypothetical protein
MESWGAIGLWARGELHGELVEMTTRFMVMSSRWSCSCASVEMRI